VARFAGTNTEGVFPVTKVFNELAVRGEKEEVPANPAKPGKRGIVAAADDL
jgi:hypothetical protein